MKSCYAVRALTELARREASRPHRPIRLADIAERRLMPARFLEQVFATMRRGGLVRSRRGAAGGYLLARPADEISVLDVVVVFDGVPSPVECVQGQCTSADVCSASSVWCQAQRAFEQVLGHTSIGDLLTREDALRVRALAYEI